MATARRAAFPVAPDLPPTLTPAPGALESGDVWEEIEAADGVEVGEWVADARLRESVWTQAQLLGRRFTGLVCQDVRFVRCDLAGATLRDAQLTRVTFESCRLSGTSFAGATLQEVHVVDCVADLADFRMAKVRRTAAEDTNLRDAEFYSAELVDVRFAGCDLTRANFETARPQRLDLRRSTLEDVRGPAALAGSHIDTDQVLPLGVALVAALGFRIE